MSEHLSNHHAHNPEEHKNHHKYVTHDEKIISRLWQMSTVTGNAIIGAAEIATGNVGTLSVTADGIHNFGDAGSYFLQTENVLNPNLSEKRQKKRRKIAHWIIAVGSLGIAAKAGAELTFDHETTPNPFTIYTALSSVGLNSLLLAKLRYNIHKSDKQGFETDHERDLIKHFMAIDVPSAGLALTGAFAQKYGVNVGESIASITSGAIGVWAFRPTEANLNHTHDTHHHHHDDAATPKKKRKMNLKRTIAAASAIAVFGTGITLANSSHEDLDSHKKADGISEPHLPQHLKKPPEKKPNDISSLEKKIKIRPGDSQWNLVADVIQEARYRPTNRTTNIIVDFTVKTNSNEFPNPDVIREDKYLKVPTKPVIKLFVSTLNKPLSELVKPEDKLFAQDLDQLNKQPKISKKELLIKEKKRLQRIKNYVTRYFVTS